MKRTRKLSKAVLAGLIGLVVMAVSSQASALGDTWETKAPMLTAKEAAASGAIDGKLYVTSAAGGTNLSNNEAYDPATDTWSTKTPSPTSRGAARAGVIDGKLYVVGGCIASPPTGPDCIPGNTNLLEVYDPATDTWTTKAPMPTARNHVAVGVIDGKLYVVGGMQQCGPCIALATLEVYDPVTDTWDTTKAPMPTARVAPAAGVIDGKLYVAGGAAGSTFFNTLEVYDPVTDTWDTTKAPMPTARFNAAAGVLNARLYVVGGQNASDPDLATLEAYDPMTDTWTTRAPMPTGRVGLGAAVIDGLLYAAGGVAPPTPLATLEVYTPITPFAALDAKVEIELGPLANDDAFEVKATFTLGAGSDGIAPLAEDVSFQVGTFSTTIPAGSFKVDKKGRFKFEGVIGGVSLQAKIIPLGANSFEFKAEGTGADLTGTVNPVTVELTIGDDGGSTTVEAEFE